MGILGFGKKKKTLDERAKEFRIILGVPLGNGYEHCTIKRIGESAEIAENRLFEGARDGGATHLFIKGSPEILDRFNPKDYVIYGVAYRPIETGQEVV